jgi:trehalose utilization protein
MNKSGCLILNDLEGACTTSSSYKDYVMIRVTIVALLTLGLAWTTLTAADTPVRVLVWDEQQPEQKQAYGDKFLGETIAAYLGSKKNIQVKSVGLSSPEQGLDEASLDQTDVIVMWAHKRSKEVKDANAERVMNRVIAGHLGLIAIHSAHWTKPFVRLMQERAKADAMAKVPEAERASAKWTYLNKDPIGQGVKDDTPFTPALEKVADGWSLALPRCVFPKWRPDGAPSHVTTLLPEHPIARGIPATWDVPHTEMYGGPFHVPKPDAVIFSERWDKGETFDYSGAVWNVGKGKVFYFRPGHETYAVFKEALPLLVIENAVRWLATPTP